jgi:hypothetical protein
MLKKGSNRISWLIQLLILISSACIDRLDKIIPKVPSESITISGYISDQPPPYEVRVFNVFDIESKENMKTPISVKRVELYDGKGNSEIFSEVNPGIYQTSEQGIKGETGGIYKIQVELNDGRIYESIPDTILAAGVMDSLYIKYEKTYKNFTENYAMDVFFDASYKNSANNKLMWRLTTTFKALTHPEANQGECFYLYEIGKCNWVPPCSGYRNIGSTRFPVFEKQFPCTCCECWYGIYNDDIILSDQFVKTGTIDGLLAKSIPLNSWMFKYKTRVSVSQLSLTDQTFRFWKAMKDQKDAIGNLFQPVSGKIPHTFTQLSGREVPAEGLFYATGTNSKTIEIHREDLPANVYLFLPSPDSLFYGNDCRYLFSNSTNVKPPFWND